MWSHQRSTNKELLTPAKYLVISWVSHTEVEALLSFITSYDTNFCQPSLRKVKLCSKCSEVIHVWLAMQSTLAYNASSQMVSRVKDSKCKEGYVSQHGKKFWLDGMETQGFPSATPLNHTIPAQSLQYKIFLLGASYKLRVPLICPHITKQSSCNTYSKGCYFTKRMWHHVYIMWLVIVLIQSISKHTS